jgi:hypothetical protein
VCPYSGLPSHLGIEKLPGRPSRMSLSSSMLTSSMIIRGSPTPFEVFAGVHILRLIGWPLGRADLQLYCDAFLSRLGFWSFFTLQRFVHPSSPSASCSPEGSILSYIWLEALCVASAVVYSVSLSPSPVPVAVFTDNLDTVLADFVLSLHSILFFFFVVTSLSSHH